MVILEATLFSSATPLGVLIGTLSSAGGGVSPATSGLVMATSGGTFIYISLVEILQEEFESHAHSHGAGHVPPQGGPTTTFTVSPLLKYVCWSIGVLGMGGLGVVM